MIHKKRYHPPRIISKQVKFKLLYGFFDGTEDYLIGCSGCAGQPKGWCTTNCNATKPYCDAVHNNCVS